MRTASSVFNMEFGKVERTLSKKLNSTVVVYKSKSKPGYAYRFNGKNGDEYVCCRCRELGKYRARRHETHITSHSRCGNPFHCCCHGMTPVRCLSGSSVTTRRVRIVCHRVQLGDPEFDVYGVASCQRLIYSVCFVPRTAAPEERS